MQLNSRVILGLIIIAIGLNFLLDLNLFRFLLPALIIYLGIRVIQGGGERRWSWDQKEETDEDKIDYETIFGELNKKIVSDNFLGGKVNTIFAGGQLDLRDAKIKSGETAVLEISSVFGGIKIIVPEDWAVSSQVTGIFGGFANNTRFSKNKESGRLLVKGAAIFGGGEVANQ